MSGILKLAVLLVFLWPGLLFANEVQAKGSQVEQAQTQEISASVDALSKPLYSPFIERYVLDELKQLRIDLARNRQDLLQQILDREHQSVDRAVSYATNTVTYFFYMIAAATSVLVLVGWTSIRDIRERVHSLADEEISRLVNEYEQRLEAIEAQLQQKTRHIEDNREEIERTQEVQSLWLRAQQESSPPNKINIYDEILKLRHDDCEALTYKADMVLELDEPQWAANLCIQALEIDPENSHAFYQLACAYTAMGQFDDAVRYLAKALSRRDSYMDEIRKDPALQALVNNEAFPELKKLLEKSQQLAGSTSKNTGSENNAPA
jgi:tetratricopeptide (TPR) repeat protein